MDDKQFDDILRDKLEGMDEPAYDPSSFAKFQARTGSEFARPWYRRHSGELAVAAASVVLALFLVGGQYALNKRENDQLRSEIARLESQNEKITALEDRLNSIPPTPDTLRIVQYVPNAYNEQELIRLRNEVNALGRLLASNQVEAARSESAPLRYVYVGQQEDLSPRLRTELESDYELVEEGGYVFLLMEDFTDESGQLPTIGRMLPSEQYALVRHEFVPDSTIREVIVEENIKPAPYSVKQQVALERHYQKGVGIELGPSFQFGYSSQTPNRTGQYYGGGAMVHFILSPTIGIQTGVLMNTNHYDIRDLENVDYPDVKTDRGEFIEGEVNNWFIEIPVLLTYRRRIGSRAQLQASVGMAPVLFTRQAIDYDYQYETTDIGNIRTESSYVNNSAKWYAGTLNAGIGYVREFENNKRLQASLFYKYGLTEMGDEQVNVNYLGIRTNYFFRVR